MMLSVVLTFVFIYFLLNFIKPGQNIELIATFIIVFLLYKYDYLSAVIGSSKTSMTKDEINLIVPDMHDDNWLDDWKKNLTWIDEYNPENYVDIVRGLDHFQELYQDIMNSDYKSNQKYDSLKMLKQEILKILQSTNLSVSTDALLKSIEKTHELLENQLNAKEAEVSSVINQQWDSGRISYMTSPVYNLTNLNSGNIEPVNYLT